MTILQFALSLVVSAPGSQPSLPPVVVPSEAAQIARLQAHYANVVSELASADMAQLNPAQRAERTRLIGVLREFGECGDFGHNLDFPAAREPYFRDAEGRRCAVAELMHASSEDAFVERVRVERNHAWICDLAGDPTFERWLERSGFSLEDAGRIHGPPVIETPGQTGAGGSYRGPGDTVNPTGTNPTPQNPRPSGGGGSNAPKGGSNSGGGSATPTSSGPASPSMPRPVTMVTTSDDSWWLWWEYNKSEYLRPNRLTLGNAPMTGDDADAALRSAIDKARRAALPLFEKALLHDDANVRGTAAIALGRVGSGPVVPSLLKMLGDANVEVRHKAILALGATGTAEGVLPLLAIARYGSLTENSTGRISPFARPLAIVALGLGRRHDFDDRLDAQVAKLIQDRTQSDREAIGVAALVYQMLAPCKELERYALAMAKDDEETPSVRCRAVESLRSSTDPEILSELQHFLAGPRLDLRRSAALALGEFQSPLALPALMTAFELESEPLTRGFVLISIGKQGGEKAQGFLTKVLEKGETGMRHWAAIALGIDVRRLHDIVQIARLTSAIRDAQAREKSQDGMGAYWIALGLARDPLAHPLIRNALNSAADARQRMYAASALALIGDERALETLRTRLEMESQALVRVAIADALGVLGHPVDVAPMLGTLMTLNEGELQGLAASAMAANGSAEALFALQELARTESGSNVRRAAAIEGLGMILAPTVPLAFADVSREANYTVFTDWIKSVFQTTL